MEKLNPGDLVQLKSGGPVMTIELIDENEMLTSSQALCSWFDGKKLTKESFSLEALTKPVPPPMPSKR